MKAAGLVGLRVDQEHREDTGSLVSSKSSPHHPSKRCALTAKVRVTHKDALCAFQCCRPFSHGYREILQSQKNGIFIPPSPPKNQASMNAPCGCVGGK